MDLNNNSPTPTKRSKKRKTKGPNDKPVFVSSERWLKATPEEQTFWRRYSVHAQEKAKAWYKSLTIIPEKQVKDSGAQEFSACISEIASKPEFVVFKESIIKTAIKSFTYFVTNSIQRDVSKFEKSKGIVKDKKRKREGRATSERTENGQWKPRIFPEGFVEYFSNKKMR
ncbi:hypothetical protein AKO1_002097, partial [Acrasis kona]